MSFPTGWSYRCSLTIDADQVSGTANLTNFPVLLTEVNFPSTIFDNTQTTGADLRFTSDEAGTTELAFEIVNWDTTNDKAEVWVKVTTVDCDDDTTFYVWYGNEDATAYAHTDTYGTHAVWSDYDLVAHLETETSLVDSSPNGYDMTAIGTPVSTTGKVGKGVEFNGSSIGYARKLKDSPNLTGTTSFTYTMWAQTHANGWKYNYCVGWDNVSGGRADIMAIDGSRACYWGSGGLVTPHPTMTLNTWHHLTLGYDAVNQKAYFIKDGNIGTGVIDSTTARLPIGNTGYSGGDTPVSIGCSGFTYGTYGSWWDGYMDEIRVQNTVYRSPDWSITEYNNQSSPATFVTEGTEEDVGSTSVTITPDALTATSVINDCTISTVRHITTQLSEQTLTSSQPALTVVLPQNITVVTTVQSLTTSQPNITVYPLAETTTASSVIFIANREKLAVKLNSNGSVYWELD